MAGITSGFSLLDQTIRDFRPVVHAGRPSSCHLGGERNQNRRQLTSNVALFVSVHLDALLAVSTLIDDAILLKRLFDLFLVGVAREVGHVNGPVLLDLGLLVGL